MKTYGLIATTMVLALLFPIAVFAQETASTVVTVPVGTWTEAVLNNSFQIILALVLAVYAWAMRSLPSGISGILKTFRVDQMLVKAVEYGISMVVTATKDKKWDVNLSSAIVAQAVTYVISKMPEWMKGFIGPIENLVDMILARIQPFLGDDVDGALLKQLTLGKLGVGGQQHLSTIDSTLSPSTVVP